MFPFPFRTAVIHSTRADPKSWTAVTGWNILQYGHCTLHTALVVQGYQSVPHVKGTPDAHSNLLEHTTVYVCTVVDLSGFGNMLMDTVVMDVVFFQIMYLILLLIYLISFFFSNVCTLY